MIEFKNITKTFNKNVVLKNVSFKVPDNSIYGLIGTNGAGKSTILRLLSGVLKEDSGQILIDKENVFDNEKAKEKLVFISDDLYFVPNYSLIEIAKLYSSLYKNFDMNYFKTQITKLKLNENTKLETLSKGVKKACSILLALSCNTKYILLDEVFDGLDIVLKKHIKKLMINHITKKNSSIIITSHNLKDLEDMCDHLALLHEGSIAIEDSIDSLKSNMIKVQIAFQKDFDKDLFKDIDIISFKKIGNVATLILEDKKDVRKKLENMKPKLLEFLNLNLEEVFIIKVEELGYEFN